MVQDKFNIDMIYLTKKGGVTWFMNNSDPESDSRFYIGSSTNGLTKSGTYWKCNKNDKVRLNAQTPKTVTMDNSIGGCKMDFAAAEDRGHAGMSDAWKNVEMTGTINLTNFSPSDGRFILKGPTFHHDNPPCCSGHAYGVRFFFRNPLQIQFFKEMWHVNYFSRPDVEFNTKYGSIMDGNDHVCKFIVYSRTKNNKEVRVLEAWIDDDGDGKNFTKLGSVTDAGGWGDGGGQCNGDDDQILTWGSGWMQYRWDADGSTDIKFKNWSCREIDVDLDTETNPTDPIDTRNTVTTLDIPLTICFDVNARRTSQCATGITSDPFYTKDVTQDSSNWRYIVDASGQDHRTRVALYVPTSGSGVYHKTPVSAWWGLNKVGSPSASIKVFSKIWTSGGTVKYTSPTQLDPSTLTSTMAFYNFDFSTNTYNMQIGDFIGIEYLGTDINNCIRSCFLPEDAGTDHGQYEGSPQSWDIFDTRVTSCKLFE